MKKIMQSVTAFLLAIAMVGAPVAEAQTRGRAGHAERTGASAPNSTSSSKPSRPSTASRPGNSSGNNAGANRPGGSQGNGSTNRPGQNKPGNNNNNRPSRPGSNNGTSRPGNNNRPGNNGNYNRPGNAGNHRPGNQPGVAPRPPQQPQPQPGRPGGSRPGNNYRPGYQRPTPPPPPHRHDYGYRHPVPFFGNFRRPVPPPAWRYRSGGPVFGTILGVALGTAIGASINALVNSGYTVSSYGDDVVYLQNVPQMNYTWPNAALYYNNGVLYGSQFTYPTAYYDMSRYNNLYSVFSSRYGVPVQTSNSGGVMSASWFGADHRYVTLSFGLQNGSYYTTLSFGN